MVVVIIIIISYYTGCFIGNTSSRKDITIYIQKFKRITNNTHHQFIISLNSAPSTD
jgi:uncharacterized protein YneF (UPF0154 family)